MYETYGSYDLHVLVWSDWDTMRKLKRAVIEQFPDALMEIMQAKNFYHVNSDDSFTRQSPTLVGAVAIQEGFALPGLDQLTYLRGEYPRDPPSHSIRAFTYVSQAIGVGSTNSFVRVAIVEGVRRKMKELASQTENGKRRFPKIDFVELSSEGSDDGLRPLVLVSFVAAEYHFLHQVPIAITELGEAAVTAPTFLETGRIVIQSDKILI